MKLAKTCTLIISLIIHFHIIGQDLKQKGSIASFNKTSQNHHYSKFNINNISTFIYNDGDTEMSSDNQAGTEFPKGNGKTVVYQSGFSWGCTINGERHLSGSLYKSGLLGGNVQKNGIPINPENSSVRVYRVRSDYLTADLSSEIEDEELSEFEIRNQYKIDWNEWPAEIGAPFIDLDNNGIYNPNIDIPGVPGADQTLWYVANDFDATTCRSFANSEPTKVEMQVTIWGYKNAGIPYDNVMFKKYRLINKNDLTIDTIYISQWADCDVGGSGDDYVGCDTVLNLTYSYNGEDEDKYYGNTPAAIGYSLLQGPIIRGKLSDRAFYDNKEIAGYKNLQMTTNYSPFSSSWSGFGHHNQLLFLRYNNFFRGRIDVTGVPFVDAITGKRTMFMFSGDPITQKGWVDGILHEPGDRRQGFASGPFMMAVGDTQEVIIAEIAAVGKDRINSVRLLKYYTKLLQENGVYPEKSYPEIHPPEIDISESSKGILISWDKDEIVNNTETFDTSGYKFQGYNIYQFYSDIGLKDNGYLIETFDIDDGITNITGTIMDELGHPIKGIVQHANDSGINREFLVNKDFILDDELLKGKDYYLGVSSYAYNTENNEMIESSISYINVKYVEDLEGANYSDTLEVVRLDGIGGYVLPVVTRPSALTGLDYTITFDTMKNENDSILTVWNLDRSDSMRVLENQTNTSGDDLSPIVDGMQIKVFNNYGGIKEISVISNGNGRLDSPEAAAPEWNGFPVPLDSSDNPLRPTDNQQVGTGKWMFHTGDPGQTRGSYEAFLSRSFRNDNMDRLIPYDWEMRFTSRGSWALRWFEDDFLVKVPFELWNIGVGVLEDPSDDYKLIPYFLSTAAVGGTQSDPEGLTYQIDPADHSGSGGDDDPQTPWIYWIIPHAHDDGSPGTAGYNEYISQIDTTIVGSTANISFGGGTEVMARTVLFNWNGDDVSDGVVAQGTQLVPEEGTIFRITSNKPIAAGVDKFTFHAPLTIIPEEKVIPSKYTISQNYPNPFNSITTINYSLPEFGRVNVAVFNILGQKVMELVNNKLDAGNYSVAFDGSNLASGVYIYRIETTYFKKSKKMILLK